MARKPLTAANIAASRKKRKEDEARFAKRESLTGKKSKVKAAKAARQRKEFAAKQAEVERQAEIKVQAQKKAAAAKPAVDLVKAGQVTTAAAPAEEKPKGFQNVVDVFKAIIKGEKIVATTDNRVFNTGAEYVANNPAAAALILTGVAGVGKFIVGKIGATAAVAANTKTATQTAGMIGKVMAQMKKPMFVLGATGAMIGTYPWAEWALGEAKEGMIFNMKKALATGDPEVIAEFQKTSEEIFDINMWENLARLIPGANIAFGFSQKAKALQAQWKVNDKLIQDEVTKVQTGETEDERWDRVREEQAAQEKAAVDYYNEQRKLQLQWEEEAADRDMKEDAKFWAREREKQREKEAEDRQAIADFWMAYRKTAQKINDNSRPSNSG